MTRAGLTTLALALALAACGAPDDPEPPPAPPERLRAMTFNIKHGAGLLERVAEVILAEAPDLVAVQEVDVDAERSGRIDQGAELSQLTGMEHAFESALAFESGGLYGQVVLSRFPIAGARKVDLPASGEPRIAVLAEIELEGGGSIVAVSAHLSQREEEHEAQARAIVDALASSPPALVMGDMNEAPGGPATAVLAGALLDAHAEAGSGEGLTHPSFAPSRRIDFVFFDVRLGRPLEAHVPAVLVSDHRPVVATFPWPG